MSALTLSRRTALIGGLLLTPALAACGGNHAATAALPDDMFLGNPNAKVTVVEYASVSCPVCGRWYREVFPDFRKKYIDTNKIKYVYREMLVGGTDEVALAASGFLLARCAGKDKYFSIVDAIYQNQQSLYQQPREVLLNIAKSAGLTEDQFNACVKDEKATTALAKRVDANSKIDNVDSTPTFVINGTKLAPGVRTLAELDAAIAKAQAS